MEKYRLDLNFLNAFGQLHPKHLENPLLRRDHVLDKAHWILSLSSLRIFVRPLPNCLKQALHCRGRGQFREFLMSSYRILFLRRNLDRRDKKHYGL